MKSNHIQEPTIRSAVRRLSICASMILAVLPVGAYAAWTPFLTIRQVLVYSTGTAQWVQLDLGTPTNPNNCANSGNWFVLLDGSTASGRAVLTTLQTAWVAGKAVRINTNSCSAAQGNYPVIDVVSTSLN